MVAWSVAKKSEARYQDGDQFAADLRAAIAELSGAARAPVTAAPAGTGVDAQKTVAFAATPAAAFEATVVGADVSPSAAPSYDATQKLAASDIDAFAKTSVTSRPPMPDSSLAGDGKAGNEA